MLVSASEVCRFFLIPCATSCSSSVLFSLLSLSSRLFSILGFLLILPLSPVLLRFLEEVRSAASAGQTTNSHGGEMLAGPGILHA